MVSAVTAGEGGVSGAVVSAGTAGEGRVSGAVVRAGTAGEGRGEVSGAVVSALAKEPVGTAGGGSVTLWLARSL